MTKKYYYLCGMKQTTLNIYHEIIGSVLSISFTDEVQTKLFLKLVNDAIEYGETFKYFNVSDTLIQIPNGILKNCVIFTKNETVTFTEQVLAKVSK